MKTVAYYNGRITEIDSMDIPMNDRSVFFGDAVYDASMAANHILFEPDYHLDRFFSSLEKVKMKIDFTKDELNEKLQSCINLADSDGTLFVYWQASRGTSQRCFTFPKTSANIMIYIYEASLADLRMPWKVITKEDTRFLHCDIKTTDLLPAVIASEEAKQAGCQEVIFHRGNRVTECAHNNVHILKDGKFITPPLDNLILPGTCRRHFLEICKRIGVPFEERPFTLDELFAADEVIITCSSTYGARVSHIDGKEVGGKDAELLWKLQAECVSDFEKETGFKTNILPDRPF
ncbi:MAG: aminotransferase class IV [Treponema sp.]|nr:aminotransferase class IV [Treponema sp.]